MAAPMMTGQEIGSSAPAEDHGSDGTDGFESRPHRSYSIDEVRQRVSSDARWAMRAITVLYARQTASEKEVGVTREDNGVGFNGSDSRILSSFAQQIAAGRRLSEKQLAIAFERLPKYARQLHRIAYPKEES